MAQFIIRRLGFIAIVLALVSIISFIIIQLPPGDFLTQYLNNLRASGRTIDTAEVDRLTKMYGLDQPYWGQYWKWMVGIVTHVRELAERLPARLEVRRAGNVSTAVVV